MTKGKSNIIPFTDKLRISYNPVFETFTMSELQEAVNHAKGYLAYIQTEISKRKRAKQKARRLS